MEVDPDADVEGEEEVPSPEPKVGYTTTGRGRRIAKKSYRESESEANAVQLDDIFNEPASTGTMTTKMAKTMHHGGGQGGRVS
jgi:hypothetical protein